jgi:AcrR family transcriptional regulator
MDESSVSRRAAVNPSSGADEGGGPAGRTVGRHPSGTLTRERIVAAAVELVDRHGLPALSMRKLAGALDAGAMSLYRHFRDKDELLDAMADAILAGASPPEPSETPESQMTNDWRDVARAAAAGMRATLLAHPGVAPLLLHRPPIGPNSFQAMEVSLAWLRAAGFDQAEAPRAFQAIVTYVLGAVSLEAPFRDPPDPDSGPDPDPDPASSAGAGGDRAPRRRRGPAGQRERLAPTVAAQAEELKLAYESLPASRFPHTVASADHLFVLDADSQFLYGLDLILAGLEERRRRSAPP